jgi:hypothetical protein
MNINKTTACLFTAAIALLAVVTVTATITRATAQQPPESGNTPMAGQNSPQNDSMPGMDMGNMQQDMKQNPQAAKDATAAMSGREMDMGPHMFMTEIRPQQPGDKQRAQEIVDSLRPSIAKYKDYHVALADGFRIFLPNAPQKQYHFTNYGNALVAQFTFNPERPTSLLYKKTADGYELEGVMFTAPKRATEEELNKRVPLSIARWHKHVNICLPPKDMPAQQVNWKQFGAGSIATEDACKQANGLWIPQIFGWMVHVYPFETNPDKIWAH